MKSIQGTRGGWEEARQTAESCSHVNSLKWNHKAHLQLFLGGFTLIAKDVLGSTRKQRLCVNSFRSRCHWESFNIRSWFWCLSYFHHCCQSTEGERWSHLIDFHGPQLKISFLMEAANLSSHSTVFSLQKCACSAILETCTTCSQQFFQRKDVKIRKYINSFILISFRNV